MHFFETLVIAREHSRFQKLLKSGLRARDVVPVKILSEKKKDLLYFVRIKSRSLQLSVLVIQKQTSLLFLHFWEVTCKRQRDLFLISVLIG